MDVKLLLYKKLDSGLYVGNDGEDTYTYDELNEAFAAIGYELPGGIKVAMDEDENIVGLMNMIG